MATVKAEISSAEGKACLLEAGAGTVDRPMAANAGSTPAPLHHSNIGSEPCGNHREYAGETCPTCEEPVDLYGNTAYSFKYCSFPDCGCDGARLCMAGNPNDASCAMNIERGSLR